MSSKSKLNAYERDQVARANRVRKGKSAMVAAKDLQPGMLLRDWGFRFSHNESDELGRNHIKFVPQPGRSSIGVRENLDTLIEVVTEEGR